MFMQITLGLSLVSILLFILIRVAPKLYVRHIPVAGRRGWRLRLSGSFVVSLVLGYVLSSRTYPEHPAKNMRQNIMELIHDNSLIVDSQMSHHKLEVQSSIARNLYKSMEQMKSRQVAREIRVLCWIMTNPKNHKTKAFHVKATWGRHCNRIIFISEEYDRDLPTVRLNVTGGRDGLWGKTVEAFKHVYEQFSGRYDWVLKADDDTYVIVENLRLMLLPYSPSDPLYFGFHFKPYAPQGYMSGGAGYVLSKEAVHRLVTQAFDGKHVDCPVKLGAEDINVGKCLHAVGVTPGDSRDAQGRSRFFPFDIEAHVNPDQSNKNWWFWNYMYWPTRGGLEDCSEQPVSFHYVTPVKMYMLEYLVYHVSPFSVMHLFTATPPPPVTTPQPATSPPPRFWFFF